MESEWEENGKDTGGSSLCPLPFCSQPLWQFLLELLNNEQRYSKMITWTGVDTEFKLKDPHGIAREWGKRRNRLNMTYEKMSRALRYYYKKNILKKVSGKKFVYKFVVKPKEDDKAKPMVSSHRPDVSGVTLSLPTDLKVIGSRDQSMGEWNARNANAFCTPAIVKEHMY
eukprot:m.310252 g.310252  ORF g.310252 m.310252 type:complete len:170 (+) comp50410_c0_seq1:135-644(+)